MQSKQKKLEEREGEWREKNNGVIMSDWVKRRRELINCSVVGADTYAPREGKVKVESASRPLSNIHTYYICTYNVPTQYFPTTDLHIGIFIILLGTE